MGGTKRDVEPTSFNLRTKLPVDHNVERSVFYLYDHAESTTERSREIMHSECLLFSSYVEP